VRKILRVVIHQTATKQTASNQATFDAIDRYHREVMGWRKIGYHRVIFTDGEVLKGRLDSEIGAHVAGHNADSIGICLIGIGDGLPVGQGYVTPAQWKALVNVCRELMQRYGVPVERVVGHRDFPGVTKTCPGFDVGELRRVLGQRKG
jgi:N-acetylmuramoyl-L-alanine amidase